MLSLVPAATTGFTAPAIASAPAMQRSTVTKMETAADLEELAKKLNPVVGFFDPLSLTSSNPGTVYDAEAGIGYLRHAEIKHGRIAMFAFVGFIAGSNGITFPWKLTLEGTSFADIAAAGGPCAQWDALPTASKLQIFGLILFLELWSERNWEGNMHYMSGGKPGVFPPLKGNGLPHEVPFNFYDPFNLFNKKTDEQKARGLLVEINNGRAAMLGIMGFVSEARVPGSVPALNGLITPYTGEVMAPFSATDSNLPFVSDMLNYQLPVDALM